MKKTKTKPKQKLTLNKQSVRKLGGSDLSNAAGGANAPDAKTVTFPRCCRTA